MAAVMIGVDPAKRSNTIKVIDASETVLVTARFENTNLDYRRMRASVKRWPGRTWAVEGATGVGLNLGSAWSPMVNESLVSPRSCPPDSDGRNWVWGRTGQPAPLGYLGGLAGEFQDTDREWA